MPEIHLVEEHDSSHDMPSRLVRREGCGAVNAAVGRRGVEMEFAGEIHPIRLNMGLPELDVRGAMR